MIRKSLFWGLTLVLVVALVSLIIRGRQMEKRQAARPVEVTRQAPSSPVRVLEPRDLEIVRTTMQLMPGHIAHHEVEIRNRGSVSYGGTLLKIVYQDRAGKALSIKTTALDKAIIPPGSSFKAPRIEFREVPASTEKFQVSIQYAEMMPSDSRNN